MDELCEGLVALFRVGIVGSHVAVALGAHVIHALGVVAVLWTLEELVALYRYERKVLLKRKHRQVGCGDVGLLCSCKKEVE